MDVFRNGTPHSQQGTADRFTGSVRIARLFETDDPAHLRGLSVTFEPGARTAWHTHPSGQVLIVTSGCGLVQNAGGRIEKIQPGDVIWCPPGETHWHGATANTPMTHIAILPANDTVWLAQVSDEEYEKGPRGE